MYLTKVKYCASYFFKQQKKILPSFLEGQDRGEGRGMTYLTSHHQDTALENDM